MKKCLRIVRWSTIQIIYGLNAIVKEIPTTKTICKNGCNVYLEWQRQLLSRPFGPGSCAFSRVMQNSSGPGQLSTGKLLSNSDPLPVNNSISLQRMMGPRLVGPAADVICTEGLNASQEEEDPRPTAHHTLHCDIVSFICLL